MKAQTPPEVTYSDNFQSYKTPSNPPGWIDSSIGNPRPEAAGLYKAWPDPVEKKASNVVYGTKQSSGNPEGNNPRIGTFSTLSTYTFSGQGRFEYRGRVLRTTADGRVGLTFFSSYPEADRYYLIGLWSQPLPSNPTSSNLTMQLFGFGGGTPAGVVDSNVTLTPNQWYRFLIQVDDADGATKIRARFWPDGSAEPETFPIDATDSSATRLRSGRIGMWAAVHGDAYIDDLSAKSPVDHSAPTITLFESGQPLNDGAKFNRDAVPEIRVTDDLSSATYSATLDGAPYTSLTPVTVEGWHVLVVTASDGPSNISTLQINFLVDKTPPVIALQEGLNPLAPNAVFNRDVVINATVTDVSDAPATATLNGQPYELGTLITVEGTHTLVVEATDLVGWKTTVGPVSFTIDKTAPQLTFTSHQNGAVVTASRIDLAGGSDDAVTVTVNGAAATVNAAAKTFIVPMALLEGENSLVATGTDRAGNVGTATLVLNLDTRAPAITINTPAADACLDTNAVQVSGVANDPRLASVKVNGIAASAGANGAFSASVPLDEGKQLLTVEATDAAGHSASASRSVVVDRTAPVIEIRENGNDFTGGVLNRAAAMLIKSNEGELTARLDGAPYTSGAQISAEGTHTLAVTATDCAGHTSSKSVDFTIDRTPPTIRDVVPANGGTVGAMPNALTGMTDTDVVSVVIIGTAVQAAPGANGAFTLAAPFVEGVNRFTLEATDRAGNRGSLEYSVTVKTTAPIVEIRESGSPIAAGTLYNRAVTPVIRSVDPDATIAATLNGAAYTSGTTISADGAYTLRATATDALGHTGSAEATFTIDRTPPAVDITAPVASTVDTESVTVRGTAGDAVAATLNGQPLTLAAGGAFVFESFPLEVGPNALVVVAHDLAGNAGRDEVLVTRDDLGAGVLLTYPPDLSRTNRPTTDVTGRLLTPGKGTVVTVGTTPVEVDPTGLFRLGGYPLAEGENTITVTATAVNGVRTAASVRVTGDFTPPALAILESDQPLADGARFAERAVISLQSSDSGGAVVNELTIDGTKAAALPFTISTAGGHSLLAVARDMAGNETRVERTLFIGATGGTATCSLGSFDPANNAVVLSNSVVLVGRSGGALGVKINGLRATMADGSFRADVELPNEGPNTVTIVCTDADGNPVGTQETITLHRITGDPSIAITTPVEDFVSAQETITVTGTVGPGVVSADVNGVPATINGSNFTAANVRLAAGLNLLVAHGKNAAGRIGTASRRGIYLKNAPTIAISAPSSGTVTGKNSITVSGTFTNLDPASIVVTNVATGQTFEPQVARLGDTAGSFTAANVALVNGDQTLRVAGRDRLNREASATVTVRLTAGTPAITITQPAAHAYFGGGSDTFTVSGTFEAAGGSLVDVNGVSATLNGSSYTASVTFSTLSGGITPVVARVTQPDGASASATSVVTQLAAAPTVVETFPAANAVEVDTGALLLVLFSQQMDRASLDGAFRVEDAGGAPLSGSLYLDREVLTFAPATLLAPGTRYTIRVSTAAKNVAGTSLASAFAAGFNTASAAPSTPPSVDPPNAVCGQTLAVTGTAAPGARLRLEAGTLVLSATADTAGRFTFNYPLSGQSGFLALRVRVVGSDGSVSPAADVTVRIDCNGPQVLSATYDRAVNRLTIHFSEAVDAATATVGSGASIVLTLDDGRIVGGTASVAENAVTVTPSEDLGAKTFTLSVNTSIKDTIGNALVSPFSQTFTIGGGEPVPGDGSGFISGEVYDATTGRPLAGALIHIAVPTGAPVSTNTDARGRYLARLREGAHTIKASLAGYTSVWRQIVVPPGAGAIPIDIRLTRRGEASAALTHAHGGDTAVTRRVELTVPAGALAPGRNVSLTSIGGQALVGLLPLGWSPMAAAEISVDGTEEATPLAGAQLSFQVPAAEITAAAQNLTAARYDAVRDEWRVLASAVNVAPDGKAAVAVPAAGAYALVYADKAAGLTQPPLPVAGDVLAGVPAAPANVALVKQDFQLDPPIVMPTGRTVATLRIQGGAAFPSGTAVQAYIDEELTLADGSRLLDPPFATDLLLYRTLGGDLGVADFHLAPSARAAEVILEVGVDRIRVFPYPGRLDRGTLIGPEGGRVPADDKVAIEIAAGAVSDPLRATATSLTATDLSAIGTIAGFRVVGGFQLTLQRATEPAPSDLDGDGQPDVVAPPELIIPARATFSVDASKMPAPTAQVILAELLDQTPYGRMVRLAVPMMLVDPTQTGTPALRFTTKSIDRSELPVDGVLHEGRYVVLAAEAPIAFATGTIRLGSATGRLLADARVTAAPLGVAELSRTTGIYNIPVPAKPAGPFSLLPRHTTTGDGAPYTHAAAVDPGTITRVDLALVPQPPVLGNVVVLRGDPPSQATLSAGAVTTNVALTTNIRASFSPAIDPTSVTADSITVTDANTGRRVEGSAAADGTAAVWTLKTGDRLKPNGSYIVGISASIRGTNGASLARGATFNFSTVTEILNTEIHRERVRISIPDANGISRITGIAGAIPAGWQAVAVRRNRDFLVRYQATAAGDGSFSFLIGNGGDEGDKVTIADVIDLQIVNTAGNLAAIFSLTPFTSEDGKSFVVPAGAAIRYTSPEGFTLDVPAGAFDEPTVITMTAMKKEDFLDIPLLETENNYLGSVNIQFEGTANKPLGFEAPLPAGFDPAGRTFLIAEKGMSPVGPRLALIDLMQARGGKLVIDHDNVTASAVVLDPTRRLATNQTLTGSKFSKYLQMLIRGGAYMYLDIKVYGVGGAVGFAAMQGLQAAYDMIWDIYWSYYIPHIHVAERGGAILPIITGRQFTVTGFDPGTGLQATSRTYDPIPFGEPGSVTPIPSTEQNYGGPYPVYGGPFRVEMTDLEVEDVDIESIRNFRIRLSNGNVTVGPGTRPLDSDTRVTLLNASKGLMTQGTAGGGLSLSAEAGNRIVLLIEERGVDSKSPLTVVFSEPIFVGDAAGDPVKVDEFLRNQIKVAYAPETGAYSDITPQVRFSVDSGKRRVNITLSSALQSESRYRITLQPQIADIVDDAAGLKLGVGSKDVNGQRVATGGGFPLELYFDVRKPAGPLTSFSAAPSGLIRGMELAGNVLFVAAQNGGLRAFDVSNPAGAPVALGAEPGMPQTGLNTIAVHVDRHNRVYTTGQTASGAGNFRSYRVEDFLGGGTSIPIKGSKLINWGIGFSQGLGLPSNTLLSDIPESIPFRIKVILADDEQVYEDRQKFLDSVGASQTGDFPKDDLRTYTVTAGGGSDYGVQRVTVENLTLDMRWSADGVGQATIPGVVARSTDRMRVIKNLKTYAIVAHLGYGIAVYDANAIEHNRHFGFYQSHPSRLREQMVLTNGLIDRTCPSQTPDFGIIENYITTDAELGGETDGSLYSYSVDTARGVLDLKLQLPSPNDASGTRDDTCSQRPSPNTGGLLLRTYPSGNAVTRMNAVRDAIAGAAGREPIGHFGQLARYSWSITAEQNKFGTRGFDAGKPGQRDYLLIAGAEYGLIVVEVESQPAHLPRWPLTNEHVADVIWIPGGVHTVRAYPHANVAVVGDRYGRIVIVDLSRIDERWTADNQPFPMGVFPTLAKALQGASDGYGIGGDDPRILWKSEPGVYMGAAAPVFDPATGMIFAAAGTTVRSFAGIDPKVEMKVNLGAPGGLSTVGGVVPLGVPLPKDIETRIAGLKACDGTTLACKENASLAAFRLEVSLPGEMVKELTASDNELRLAVESERVIDAVTEQTPAGFPRAHLRRTRRDGSAEIGSRAATSFIFRRVVPQELAASLKTQRGYNKFVSPWIVAIADPRAAEEYTWQDASTKQQKKEQGCDECERPQHLRNKGEADGVYELWTNGRFIAVRPEYRSGMLSIFHGTKYAYLGEDKRLLGRFTTIMADTVRPTPVLSAAQNPPIADGFIQDTVYLHSGEYHTSTVDLDAGGRADFNVLFDRSYRSGTIGGTAMGQGWDSSLFRRLRALPNGEVEWRGSDGELFRFRVKDGAYVSPRGLFLKLTRTERGWKLIDQKWRIMEFDDSGRILSETDEFYDPQVPNSGNVIRYLYDQSGRLSTVVDAVKRVSRITYFAEGDTSDGAYPGLIKRITDWRDRTVDFSYDPNAGTLVKVQLPETPNRSGGRPTLLYGYSSAGGNFSDRLELRSNLENVTAPGGSSARLRMTYGTGGLQRDRMLSQNWGSGESVTVTYNSKTSANTTDALNQQRQYTMTENPKDAWADRAHVTSFTEVSVATSGTPMGQLPSSLSPSQPSVSGRDRTFSYSYNEHGLITSATFAGVRTRTAVYESVEPQAAGMILKSITTTPLGGGGEAITNTIEYQTGANSGTFQSAITANGQRIEAPEPHRKKQTVTGNNSSVTTEERCDPKGLATLVARSGGTDGGSASTSTSFTHNDENAAEHERGLPKSATTGALNTTINYPGEDTSTRTDARGVTLTTEYDPWRRPRHVTASGAGLTLDEKFEYDAGGQLVEHTRVQAGENVTTSFDYDAIGRMTRKSMTGVAGGAAVATVNYNFGGRTITINHPGGAVTTVALDGLGRPISATTSTGGEPIVDYFAFDLDSHLVFQTDLQTARAMAFDAHGRQVGEIQADGTRQTAELDAMGLPKRIVRQDASGSTIEDTTFDYTDEGKLQSATANGRTTQLTWGADGRKTGVSVAGRAAHVQYDESGRVLSTARGGGSAQSVTDAYERSSVSSHNGAFPQQVTHTDKSGSSYSMAVEFNTVGVPTTTQLGDLQWITNTDEAGNVTTSAEPNRPPATREYDSRGAVTSESLPGGGSNTFGYNATGAANSYTDPASEATSTQTDLLGRPTKRTYADGTTELIEWKGRRVKSVTDRAGRLQAFEYDNVGRVKQILGAGGVLLDELAYDDAGRLASWKNQHSVLEFSGYDADGNVHTTKQRRLRNNATVDEYTQTHDWDVHGDRVRWTMPSYQGLSPAGWTSAVTAGYDAAGNLVRLDREGFGAAAGLMYTAQYAGVDRPVKRDVTTTTGALISRLYAYNASSLLSMLTVSANGKVVAGSVVTYDGLQKKSAQLLGVSNGDRSNRWDYDGRSRLTFSSFARDVDTTPAEDTYTTADFRTALDRPATTPVDPPSVQFMESAAGHQIDRVQRGSVVEQFAYQGGERTSDALFTYDYDAKGRLILITEKQRQSVFSLRRIHYEYAGNDRLIGRRAEYADVNLQGEVGPWKPEDRPGVLASDQLPADTTFVWDPVADRLVSIFKAGASQSSTDANGGLLRQMIHGGAGYDDPLEVAVAAEGGVSRLYPVYDEAGAGSLQIILNEKGEIVSRSVPNGPYGEDEVVLLGSGVDRVGAEPVRDEDGDLTSVKLTLRMTEEVDAATVPAGVRLAVTDLEGNVLRTVTASATAGGSTITWSLTPAEWTALTDQTPVVSGGRTVVPYAISIGVTNSLRAIGWSSTAPVLRAPAWAVATRPVFATAAMPVEVREPIANLRQVVEGTAAASLYEVPNLAALGMPKLGAVTPVHSIVSSSFHAQPFHEPVTGKSYARGRWFDSQTGTWLTPDPRGYRDSSNLYAYAGGDPVNRRDPTGQYEEDVHHYLTIFLALAAGFDNETATLIGWSTQELDLDSNKNQPERSAMPERGGFLENMRLGRDNMVAYHMVTEARLAEMRGEALSQISGPGYEPSAIIGCTNRTSLMEDIQVARKWTAVGEYLHALEDSFSHQTGMKDRDFSKTFNVALERYTGHMMWGHIADHTWRRPELAMKMAEETFNRLKELCASHRGSQCASMQWSQIRGQVETFVNHKPPMTWEFVNAAKGLAVIRNVRTYEPKIKLLNSGWTIDPRERDIRDAAHQKYVGLMSHYARTTPELIPALFVFQGATEALFNATAMTQAVGRLFR